MLPTIIIIILVLVIAAMVAGYFRLMRRYHRSVIAINAFTDPNEAVIIDITNSGGLIPDDVAQHIFVPFFTTKHDGCGVGLSLSRQIMRLSNGSITLRQDKDKGLVTFRLAFL